MRVPSDIQVQVQPTRSGVLEALGLRVGQVLTGQVVGQTQSGAVQLQIGNQQLALNLPIDTLEGQVLQLQVKSAGAKPELVLLSGGAKASTPAQTAQTPTGATLNAASQASASPKPNIQIPLQASIQTSAPQSTTVNSQPIAINVPPSAQSALNLQVGQTVTGQITQATGNNPATITVNNQRLPVQLPPNLPTGTSVQLQVSQSDGALRLTSIVSTPTPSLTAPTTGTATVSTQSAQQSQTAHAAQATIASTAAGLPAPNQQAIVQAGAGAIARQDSLGALLSNLANLGGTKEALPANVSNIAQQLVGKSISPSDGGASASALVAAVAKSGVFLESNLAQGQPMANQSKDTKLLLMLLRNALGKWLGPDSMPPGPNDRRPSPPMRGAEPRGQMQNPSTLADGANAREVGRQLLGQTESALSRVRLYQLSSLPDAAGRANPTAVPLEWNFELPFNFGNQMSMAQFQISRDADPDGDPNERGWQMAFSVNFSKLGEVGAKVSIKAKKTGVMLWAESETTAVLLEETLPELTNSLEAIGLEPGAVFVRHSAPEPQVHPAGGFVDSVS